MSQDYYRLAPEPLATDAELLGYSSATTASSSTSRIRAYSLPQAPGSRSMPQREDVRTAIFGRVRYQVCV
jgi:hypothetical protein